MKNIRTSMLSAVASAVFAALVAGLMLAPAAANASGNQLGLFEEDPGLMTNPDGTMATLHSLGVSAIRFYLHWNGLAPDPSSFTRPAGFNASDPASYSPAAWSTYDRIIQDAHADGIQVLLLVAGGAPLWATGTDQPSAGPYGQWKPSASEYGSLIRALATRYSGHYTPAGGTAPLPRVNMWELWNEPNWGPGLAPQEPAGYSASMYRGLLNAGWSALQQTGHGGDTVVVGSLSPRGFNNPAILSTTKPLQFLRWLYCVDSRYRQLRGSTASKAGCPTTAGGSRQFRSQNPGLFSASGFGIHPYPFSDPPNKADSNDPDYVEFSEIPRLYTALDKLQHVYGSSNKMAIYNTEYGYETNPPNKSDHFVSPNTASNYINWAEYLSWKNSRIATAMQYLLNDPNPNSGTKIFGQGGFAAGLVFYNGGPKADYYAYRMPLFLPSTSARRNHSLEVWGCVRPAHTARGRQTVQIQFQRGSRGSFSTIKMVGLSSSRGYFDVQVTFPGSGTVRLAWRYPGGQTIYSRNVGVNIH